MCGPSSNAKMITFGVQLKNQSTLRLLVCREQSIYSPVLESSVRQPGTWKEFISRVKVTFGIETAAEDLALETSTSIVYVNPLKEGEKEHFNAVVIASQQEWEAYWLTHAARLGSPVQQMMTYTVIHRPKTPIEYCVAPEPIMRSEIREALSEAKANDKGSHGKDTSTKSSPIVSDSDSEWEHASDSGSSEPKDGP